MRVAINGFGRIGRAVFRIAEALEDIEIVAINDLFDDEALRYLLTYDTVMGRFEGDVRIEDGHMITPKSRARMLALSDPKQLPWGELEVDAVVESTGVFRSREQVSMHLEAGARRALLTVPAKDDIDFTVVLGVNEDGLRGEHRIVSNASCTTNCLAPLAKVVHDAFDVIHPIAGRKGIRIVPPSPEPATVHADPDLLKQLVVNLLENAVKFTHEGAEVRVLLEQENNAVRLIVEDDGPGIPPGELDAIFERFSRLDEARDRDSGGSGLGLAIARELVELNRGTIELTTASPTGASFVLTFPTAG